MKNIQSMVLLFMVVCAIGFAGCSNDAAVTQVGSVTDEQVLKSQVLTIDSVDAFSVSDQATIDDGGLRPDEYESVSMAMDNPSAGLGGVSIDSLYPVRWGRHITNIARTINAVIQGDTLATVTITKTITGEFWIGLGTRTPDTTVVDTVIKKPFVNDVNRKVLFRRIARTGNPFRNWMPIAVTMVEGKTRGSASFSIASMEISDNIRHYDSTFTNPLSTWFRLGLFHGSVPVFPVRDSIKVRVTITSSDTSNEIVHIRHGISGDRNHPEFRRLRVRPLSVSGSAGNYTRVYERTFVTHLPPRNLAGRFNIMVDVLSRGSIYDTATPYSNEFWGIPYIVVR
jgi:outer membrane murein-binding lipoprotein Lpp